MVYLLLSNPPGEGVDEEGAPKVPEAYNDFCVIREMGWDWWTYQRQPVSFIRQITAFISAERKAAGKREKHGRE